MKMLYKIKKTLVVLILTSIGYGGFAQTDDNERPLDNGFHLIFHSTSRDFTPSSYGLEIGNTWNVYVLEELPLAFGIRSSWLDVAFGFETVNKGSSNELRREFLLSSFFGIGPNVTYKIKDKLGAELYMKFKPTLLIDALSDDLNNGPSTSTAGLGISSAFGISARYDVFQLGLEFGGGSLTATTTTEDGFNTEKFDFKSPIKYSRFFLGFRF